VAKLIPKPSVAILEFTFSLDRDIDSRCGFVKLCGFETMYCNLEVSDLNTIRLPCQQDRRLVWVWPAYLWKGSLGENTLLARSRCRIIAAVTTTYLGPFNLPTLRW